MRRLIVGLLFVAAALLPVSGPNNTPAGVTPGPLAEMAGAANVTTYNTYSKSCANPGNPSGICWWEGYEFRAKNICLESNIPGHPLAAVARMYSVGGLAVTYRNGLGQCARSGFAASQTVTFTDFGSYDNKVYAPQGYCAYTQPSNYGTTSRVYVRVNVTASKLTPCGAGAEWQDVFAHEFGHAVGLSHNQKYASSMMRDGHTTSAQDIAEIKWIYANNPRR